MKRWMKILSAVVVVFVGLVVAGVAVLKNIDFNQYKGLVAEQVKAATGRDLQIKGDLNLAISLTPAIEVNGVSFANASWGSKPEMATIKHFAAEVSLLPLLTQHIVIKRLVLDDVDILAETNAKGRGNWEFETAKKEAAPAAPSEGGGGMTLPSIDKVALNNVRLTYHDGVTGKTQQVRIDSLTAAAPSSSQPVQFDLKAHLNDEAVTASGTLGSIDQMSNPDAVYPVNVKLAALGANVGFDGKLGTPGGALRVNGKATVHGDSLADTVKRAGGVVPALQQTQVPDAGAYDVAVGIDMQGQNVALSGLKAKLADSDLNGDVKVALGGARPSVDAKLTSSLVDLPKLLPASKEGTAGGGSAQPSGGKKAAKVFPDDPLPVDGLKAADVALGYQAGKIIVPGGVAVTGLDLAMTLKNGRLDVSKLDASSYNGKLVAKALFDASKATPALDVSAKLDGLDFGELLKAKGMGDMASGTLNGDVALKGAGKSLHQIMAGLGGHTRFVVPGGKLNSDALGLLSADIMSAVPFLKQEDQNAIRCGVVDFRIKDGIAGAKALVFETGGISAIGVGDADLGKETLNLAVDPRAKNQSLASLALTPIKIGGTFADPSVGPDPAALAGTVASSAARVGGAIATMGLSLLAEKAFDEAKSQVVDKTDYCAMALAGKQVVPGGGSSSSSSSSGGSQPAQQKKDSGSPVESIGKGLKSLFGN